LYCLPFLSNFYSHDFSTSWLINFRIFNGHASVCSVNFREWIIRVASDRLIAIPASCGMKVPTPFHAWFYISMEWKRHVLSLYMNYKRIGSLGFACPLLLLSNYSYQAWISGLLWREISGQSVMAACLPVSWMCGK
jgi:hypothetical protein